MKIFKPVLLLIMLIPATLFAQWDSLKQKQKVDSLRNSTKGFPVTPFHDTLFYVYNRQGSFTPQERAEAISRRINKLSDDYAFSADSVVVMPSESSSDILYKNNIIVSVSDKDAAFQNTTKEKLAAGMRVIIDKAVVQYQSETSWQTLLKEGLTALLVILIVILFIYAINRLFRWIAVKAGNLFNKGVKLKNYELLNAERQVYALNFVLKTIKWVIILLLIYLALPVLFGIFPFTRDISNTLLGYILSPLKRIGLAVWDYIPNLITIVVIIIIFRYVLRFLHYLKTEIAKGRLTIPGFYADWANPSYQIIRVLVLAFMLIVIFPYMPGSDSPIFKGVSVFVGILFTFGSAGALSNVVAGLVMTYMRAFKLGDRVKIGEITGDIIEKNLLVTRLRTIFNEVISIPNSTVLSSHTINYSSEAREKGLIVHTSVTIGYDAPWRQVHQLLIDAALDTPLVEKEPKPFVRQTSLDDYFVSYCINAYTHSPNNQSAIYSDLHANIQDHFNKAGVEIMSPHYKALRDGNATTIPPDYLPKDYVPPPFTTQQRKG
jgi:small-conductance mechanosensitive channel